MSPLSKPRRTDARRNYERVLEAAAAVFAERGPDAPLDSVARRAGVGNATLYRHFPTRRELILAVCEDEMDALCRQGAALRTADDPAEALYSWLRAFVTHVATKRELALALADHAPEERSELFDRWHLALIDTAALLLARAQAVGAVRGDLDAPDLLALANGIAVTGTDVQQTDRLLDMLRRGTDAAGTPDAAGPPTASW